MTILHLLLSLLLLKLASSHIQHFLGTECSVTCWSVINMLLT